MCEFGTDKGGRDPKCLKFSRRHMYPPPSVDRGEREGGVSNAAARQKQIDSSSSFLNIFPALLVNFSRGAKGIRREGDRAISLSPSLRQRVRLGAGTHPATATSLKVSRIQLPGKLQNEVFRCTVGLMIYSGNHLFLPICKRGHLSAPDNVTIAIHTIIA